jgi:predicted TIM-barrel fold metal-dependent hydrolase
MSTISETKPAGATAGRAGMPVIDADIHANAMPQQLAPWMPRRWRDYAPYGNRYTMLSLDLVRAREWAARSDSFPPGGGIPGSDPDFIIEQLLDRYDISYGLLNMFQTGIAGTGPKGYTAAICHATNHWMAEEFFAKDPRWIGCLTCPYEFGGKAVVDEIEFWAEEKKFVQLIMSMRTEKPLGDPKYWDMYEACEALGMPVSIHPATTGNNSVTGSGWPSYYFEDHVGYPQAVPAHIASMICEGVFDRFPRLKFVVVEGGWSYAGWLCSRLDGAWRVLRAEVPDLQRMPSEYVRERVWFTSQPIEEPEDPRLITELLDRSGVESRLMYSSDYPHWDFDSPDDAIPASLPLAARQKIFFETAAELYGLELSHPGGE